MSACSRARSSWPPKKVLAEGSRRPQRACEWATAWLYVPRLECEVSLMNALRALGLAWIALGTAPTGASAQTTAPSPPPPIRLPGIVYPAPAEARTEPSAPALKPQGPTSRIHAAPNTPASPRPVVADP